MSYIKIVRLKNGEDIIGFVEAIEKKVLKIRYPVSVAIHYNHRQQKQELLMNYWLPVSLIEENKAEIPNSEILLIMEVKEEFKEYYLNYLNDFSIPDELEKEEEFKVLLENLDVKNFGKVH